MFHFELIDTLWNVNSLILLDALGVEEELIDTLWNVNSLVCIINPAVIRINRYIMECKLVLPISST